MAGTRRDFLRTGARGLVVLSAGRLVLDAAAQPTESSGDAAEYLDYLERSGDRPVADQSPLALPSDRPSKATEDNILGPFYRPGAPYRAKSRRRASPATCC
jgi:hypothetical protein